MSEQNNLKDPYLKPVIYAGLIISILTMVFAPGLFLWAMVGGYIAVRMSSKILNTSISNLDSTLIGLFSGLFGGACVNIIIVLSFNNSENKRGLISVLEKNWPLDMQPIPNFSEILPLILLSTCLVILIVTILFSIVGSLIAQVVYKKKFKL